MTITPFPIAGPQSAKADPTSPTAPPVGSATLSLTAALDEYERRVNVWRVCDAECSRAYQIWRNAQSLRDVLTEEKDAAWLVVEAAIAERQKERAAAQL